LYKQHFEEYMEFGGIPRYVLEKNPGYMIELVDSIIVKDIVAYHKLKDVQVLKELFLLISERAGKRLSYNKIAKILSLNVESVR
jgi:uncharacterized protein